MNRYQFISEALLKKQSSYYKIDFFPVSLFVRDVTKLYKSSRIQHILQSQGIRFFGHSSISIHSFFIPEFLYILRSLPDRMSYRKTINELQTNSWISNTTKSHSPRIRISNISKNMNVELSSYQTDFLKVYDQKVQQYKLNGYILGFEQGLGKTLTGLALMESLSKDCIIIIAPKSTLSSVWKSHLDEFYKMKNQEWIVNTKTDPKNKKFYIFNYESLSKFNEVKSEILAHKNIGIIVDESHNFLHLNSIRTKNLHHIQTMTNCEDLLLMSGTPIKAMGVEMISALILLDKYFDDDALEIFKKAFGLNTEFAAEILKTRMGIILHRKLKREVLDLPEKHERVIKVKIPNGNRYTLKNVKEQVIKFVKVREQFYSKERNKFKKDFEECITYLEKKMGSDPQFKDYLKTIRYLENHGYDPRNRKLVELVKIANEYERVVIIPVLPKDLKQKFIKSKSVVKYLELKIRGEVLGGLLPRLRAEMTFEVLQNSEISKIIRGAVKKTICFTTFANVAREAIKYFELERFKPILMSGDTSGDIKTILSKFKTISEVNPLVATIQTLSTGVTLTEANTMFFLNKPWRDSDYRQASDRIHRIGQDSEVTIYTLLLDTGPDPNLSTRMEDIMNWSKEMFQTIVGKD